jgi:hypothetical protein
MGRADWTGNGSIVHILALSFFVFGWDWGCPGNDTHGIGGLGLVRPWK